MEENLAYCGLTCHNCPICLATREQDEEIKYKMKVDIAQEVKKRYGQECKPEDITDCDGCKTETGILFSGCKNCHIRNCARENNQSPCLKQHLS